MIKIAIISLCVSISMSAMYVSPSNKVRIPLFTYESVASIPTQVDILEHQLAHISSTGLMYTYAQEEDKISFLHRILHNGGPNISEQQRDTINKLLYYQGLNQNKTMANQCFLVNMNKKLSKYIHST
ncbi:MAG TPA: hypothetical protein VGW78_07310 [Candidatus Babeliales bacterium]|jgi:hypothetical protein|nr:hypothetical protein [Candidatus Babeliales bacterium]